MDRGRPGPRGVPAGRADPISLAGVAAEARAGCGGRGRGGAAGPEEAAGLQGLLPGGGKGEDSGLGWCPRRGACRHRGRGKERGWGSRVVRRGRGEEDRVPRHPVGRVTSGAVCPAGPGMTVVGVHLQLWVPEMGRGCAEVTPGRVPGSASSWTRGWAGLRAGGQPSTPPRLTGTWFTRRKRPPRHTADGSPSAGGSESRRPQALERLFPGKGRLPWVGPRGSRAH